MQVQGLLVVSPAKRFSQGPHVTLEIPRIQADVVPPPGPHDSSSHLRSEGVENLAERVARVGAIRLGPEESHEDVPTEVIPVPAKGQVGEDGYTLGLGKERRELLSAVIRKGDPAQ